MMIKELDESSLCDRKCAYMFDLIRILTGNVFVNSCYNKAIEELLRYNVDDNTDFLCDAYLKTGFEAWDKVKFTDDYDAFSKWKTNFYKLCSAPDNSHAVMNDYDNASITGNLQSMKLTLKCRILN